jgi:diaminopimelate decarboxylase|tara:strand:- start:1425 stop:2684 length:1260 start_codon:yes stop_codon:yes gene_type:complete
MMKNKLEYIGSVLHQEQVSLVTIAETTGTPSFVYSKAKLLEQYQALKDALEGLNFKINYSVKANSNLSILSLLKDEGSGFDIVSAGELGRVLAIGGDPTSVVFSGVGKSTEEIDFALKNDIGCINVESSSELDRVIWRAKILGRKARVSIRVNPDVDADTHPYISTGLKESKFGVPISQSLSLFEAANQSEHVSLEGIDCHIGSQISSVTPLAQAIKSICKTIDELSKKNITINHVNVGGGLGIRYKDEAALSFREYGQMLKDLLGSRNLQIFTEPGRSIVAESGLLLCRVEFLKRALTTGAPNFAIVDAGMNDLLRPSLYGAWHQVMPVVENTNGDLEIWDIVGPICESGDFLAKQRELRIEEGSLLAIMNTGAYGMSLSSNYNSRSRCCEVLVDDEEFRIIRKRETLADQIKLEIFD